MTVSPGRSWEFLPRRAIFRFEDLIRFMLTSQDLARARIGLSDVCRPEAAGQRIEKPLIITVYCKIIQDPSVEASPRLRRPIRSGGAAPSPPPRAAPLPMWAWWPESSGAGTLLRPSSALGCSAGSRAGHPVPG